MYVHSVFMICVFICAFKNFIFMCFSVCLNNINNKKRETTAEEEKLTSHPFSQSDFLNSLRILVFTESFTKGNKQYRSLICLQKNTTIAWLDPDSVISESSKWKNRKLICWDGFALQITLMFHIKIFYFLYLGMFYVMYSLSFTLPIRISFYEFEYLFDLFSFYPSDSALTRSLLFSILHF